jgi:hypothetical protein
MTDEEVTEMVIKADSFLPRGKLRMPDGEIRNLLDTDFRMEYEGGIRQALAWVEADKNGLEACPVCEGRCPEGAFILITDTHILYPCWVCNQLVEKKTTEEKMKEKWI